MPRSIFINIKPLRFIHLSNDRETISIVSFASTSPLLIVSLSLSLFFGFQITRTKKFIKEWRAKVGNFQFIPLSPRDYFHRVKLVRLWKILLSLVNRIFRALCSNKGSLCFQSLLLQFFDKIQLPSALLSAIFQTEKFRVGPESILSRIIRLSKTS